MFFFRVFVVYIVILSEACCFPGGDLRSTVVEFDDGSKGWIPIVLEGSKPLVNAKLSCYEDVESMYRTYANLGGFDVRRNARKIKNDGLIQNRWLV